MNEAVFVEEINTSDGLDKEIESSLLSETALFLDQHEQVTLGNVFHHEVDILFVF